MADAVLDRVLGLDKDDFVSCPNFRGKREGYVFKNGDLGLGYYRDSRSTATTSRKREREYEIRAEEDDDEGEEDLGRSSIDVNKLVDQAEDIKALDVSSLKALLLKLEKKINHNQDQRIKFAKAPEKFMDSELDLHAVITELSAVAASPELYPTILQTESLTSILGLITHDNTDVSLACVSLLQEMTDSDTLEGDEEVEEYIAPIIDKLVELQGLELVVLNLNRLDESNEEDAQGVYTTLALLENLVTLRPALAALMCEKTHVLKFLTERISPKKRDGEYDANKLNASELLSVLLQASPRCQSKFLLLHDVEGLEMLLQTLAAYRKRDPESLDEAEFVQNVTLALCAVLLQPEGRSQFCAAEGFELMVRCLKGQKFVTAAAIRITSYATQSCREGCLRLVEAGGLRFVFPLIMGLGLPQAYSSHGSGGGEKSLLSSDMDAKELSEVSSSLLSQLVLSLHDATEHDAGDRLKAKFTENNGEKALRCVELFGKAAKRLQRAERGFQRTLEAAIAAGDEETVQQYGDEDSLYTLRLQTGLFALQQLASIIAFVFVFCPSLRAPLDAAIGAEGGGVQDVLAVLREWASNIDEDEDKDKDQGSGKDDPAGQRKGQRHTLISWCAALAALNSSS
jgi:beta-catenin-like protein 1